ncbi:amino acid adenylation domain-containing protein [Chitinimonas lacunae]|uniref:Amino acid adenylation domain-containing protein n=1 Tax=Chitinimonas lacunae TaxID=1963018 RepID=A0ABV8MM29_9NEIS
MQPTSLIAAPSTNPSLASRRLDQWFEASAARLPEALAVVADGQALNYAQLNQQADQFAAGLVRTGVQAGDIVALACGRSVDMVVAILGVLKSGAVYLPLDLNLPDARLGLMVKDSAAVLVVCSEEAAGRLADCGAPVCLCGDWSVTARPAARRHPEAAYCIYTSGSTGTPKGVLVAHHSVANLIGYWLTRVTPAGGQPFNASLWTSFGFDVSVFELFVPLALGGAVHIVAEAVKADPLGLLDWLTAQAIEFAYLPPFLMRKLAELPDELVGRLSLRSLLVGVEPLREADLARLKNILPELCIINGYGPTETTVFCTAYLDITDHARPAPLGQAIDGARVYLLGPDLQAVDGGEIGEIYVAGACLAEGYLGRPDLTAERFLPDPFGPAGTRMYRTGDLGRQLPDGHLVFCGRKDDQIKLNGYRIELGEIEQALSTCTGVRDAAVAVWDGAQGTKRLVAYVVAQDGVTLSVAGLSEQLGRLLPEYMVPASMVLLGELPLGVNGKLDRKALPAPAATLTDYVAPRTELAQQLATIWAEVLQLGRVGMADGFRSLGGSSMQAIEISFRIARRYGCSRRIPLPLSNITLADYVPAVEAVLAQQPVAPVTTPAAQAGRHPFSYAQEQVWFLEQMGEAWRAYRFHARFRLRGPLQIAALRQAVNQLIERHTLLRTRFLSEGETLQCELLPSLTVEVPVIDLSAIEAAQRLERLAACLREELDFRFDIAEPPLVRWVLIRLAAEEHILLQSEHHNVHDGQSMRILIGDLAALYSAACTGESAVLEPVEADYRTFCLQEKAWLASPDFSQQLDRWAARLVGHTDHLKLFSYRPAPPERSFRGAQLRHTVDDALLDRINATAAGLGVSRYVLMLAVFGVLIARYNDQKRFLIGGALANRCSPLYRRTVGMFVNMVPIPFDLERAPSFPQLVQALNEETDFALAHSGVPLAEIVKRLQLTQRLKGEAPFNVSFSFHDSLPASFDFRGLEVELEEGLPNGSAKFDLSVVGILGNRSAGKAMELVFGYNTDLFDTATIERMAIHYQTLLEAVIAEPQAQLKQLPMLSEAEVRQLTAWNDTAKDYPRCAIHELFEAQAAASPDAVAVVFGEQQLSYGELNRRANQLAHQLVELGVRADTLVGICVERSLEMVVGLFAILKAGGAYVPLDPDYPAERLAYLLEDCAAPLLLTQSWLLARLPEHSARVICLDTLSSTAPDTNLTVRVQAEHLAYCLYTSGSTGRPKGVQLSHQAVLVRLHWMQETYRLTGADRLLQKTSLGFDVSVWELFWTLGYGARLIVPQQQEVRDLERLADRMVDSQITFAHFTPAVLEQMVDNPRLRQGHSLRFLVSGGETLPVGLFKKALALSGGAFHNRYGPTEAAINATYWVAPQGEAHRETAIGRPLANTRIYLLDADLQPVPVGVPAEIYIAGPGLARGYLNQPALTQARFLADPFGPAGERMYRSGDLGRYLPDGNIEFLGRVDHQVKLRGFRIELGEIESSLRACDGVREAVVTVDPVQLRLVAYVVAAAGVDAETLRQALRRQLPDYMVPSSWVFLDVLPLNANGKVDRQALPAPEAPVPSQAVMAADALSPTAQQVLELMRSIVADVPLDPYSDFFDVGFHSINLMRLVAKSRSAFGVPLSIVETIDAQSPAAFAELIEEKLAAEAAECD